MDPLAQEFDFEMVFGAPPVAGSPPSSASNGGYWGSIQVSVDECLTSTEMNKEPEVLAVDSKSHAFASRPSASFSSSLPSLLPPPKLTPLTTPALAIWKKGILTGEWVPVTLALERQYLQASMRSSYFGVERVKNLAIHCGSILSIFIPNSDIFFSSPEKVEGEGGEGDEEEGPTVRERGGLFCFCVVHVKGDDVFTKRGSAPLVRASKTSLSIPTTANVKTPTRTETPTTPTRRETSTKPTQTETPTLTTTTWFGSSSERLMRATYQKAIMFVEKTQASLASSPFPSSPSPSPSPS
eukprot:CAMPEP_0201519946 /NCGR_PEP_ID=MMETSP0161_2-20130828/10368_1 /ASSEMBLY_ACC=CAM_ASM_000251 /TAXON_ID=180227 /ORGANISM="Neoparamoeba aestuarina, Strain SoJaBio B1-5/56/2" /LENGTH=296 /DNA_ID=CAMNT_0047918147 /DNA_START=286 /DNA_END=1173 /DNA_ORIENTATION=+